MRFNVLALSALLPVAGLLAGCAMGTQGVTSAAATAATKTISGKSFGGQQAVADGQVVVYEYGSSGYGSAGTALAVTTTDSNGDFTVNYSCSATATANTPVYILSIGGQPGINLPANSAIVLGAGLGTCSASQNEYVIINEVSTTALAFSLSHFFSTSTTDLFTSDHFGAPASLTQAIQLVNSGLIPQITSVQDGYPQPSTATFTNESSKILTIADILGSCVNSIGPSSPACTQLFLNTTPPGSTTRPADTLQAAVNMALYPSQNVGPLYSLVAASGSSAFSGSLAVQPNDWTLAVSYTSPNLGLGNQYFDVTTLDIDSSGRVWFPSNVPGAGGLAYFDPSGAGFSSVFAAPGLVRPTQVAIDINGVAWTNDLDTGTVAGFPGSNPTTPITFNLPGTISNSLTVRDDNSLTVSVLNNSSAMPSLAEIAAGGTSYVAIPNTTTPGSQGYLGVSLAGDTAGGTGASAADTYTPNVYLEHFDSSYNAAYVLFQAFADPGQVVFTGQDFVAVQGGFNAPSDAICVFSVQTCYPFANQAQNRHPTGLSIDGGSNLWLSDEYTQDVQEVASNGGTFQNGSGQAPNQVFIHGTNNGGTIQVPGGIGVDNTGNVWVSNIGCLGTDCTPTPFVLTEIIGAGVPTVTPISAQVVLSGSPGIEPMSKKPSK